MSDASSSDGALDELDQSVSTASLTYCLHERGGGIAPAAVAASLAVRSATPDDVPYLRELEKTADNVLHTPAVDLVQCTAHSLTGVHVAVAPDGRLVGAAYTQSASAEVLLQPKSAIAPHSSLGPVLHLLGILQQPGTKV